MNTTPSSTFINTQLLNNNHLKPPPKVSLLSQVMSANDSNLSDTESVASLKANRNFDKRVDLFVLATNTDQNRLQQKKEK